MTRRREQTCAPSRASRWIAGGIRQWRVFAEYIDWRAEHPSDDLMTDLLNAEIEDETGTRAPPDP